jgi:hypothetical protein
MSDNPTGQEDQTRTSEPGTIGPVGGTNNATGSNDPQPGSFDFGMNPPNSGASVPTAPPTQNNPEMESLLGTPKEPLPSGIVSSQPTTQPNIMGPGPTNGGNSGPNIGSMPNPIPGMPPQIPQNPKTSQGPTKSHLAEILGAHEMNQLQTMARPLDHQNPAMPPAQGTPTQPIRPTNPEMMGMRPNHGMPNMGGGFNPSMASYQHMFQGMPPGGPGMPPGHFRNRFIDM